MNARVANMEEALSPDLSQAAEELTVGGTVVTAAALPERTVAAEIGVKANAVRYTLDGTDPASAGAGAILAVGNYVRSRAWVAAARFIESTGGSAGVVRIQPMRE